MSAAAPEGYARANRPLAKALIGHVDQIARHCPRRDAAGWVYATVLAAWGEDHGLTPMMLRGDAQQARKQHAADGGTPSGWIRAAYAHLAAHPSTACLLDPRYSPLPDACPAVVEQPLGALLDWWADEAPDLYNPAPELGPSSITGWLIGDLLQALHGDRYNGAALSQTPWWVADFLCARTLAPAFAVFDEPVLRVIDPACGTGHLLVWAALGLFEAYTAGVPGRRATGPRAAVRRLLAGISGVELDPLTAAVARLRLTVLFGSMLDGSRPGATRLRDIPGWVRPRVAVGNALLAAKGEHELGAVLDDTADYPGILEPGTYHAVIANPPYKVIADAKVRERVRAEYREVCHGQYAASVPFTVLMFDLAIRADAQDAAGLVAVPEQLSLFDAGAAA